MVQVKCTSEFRPEEACEPLTVTPELVRWMSDLQSVGAALNPITVDVGNQRDPWMIMVGLRADWTESR